MDTTASIYIDIRRESAANEEPKTLELNDSFFQSLDQDEIKGGQLVATYKTDRKDDFSIRIVSQLKGHVVVACDRCLNDLSIDVEAEDESVFDTTSEEETFYYTDEQHPNKFNLGWYFYEVVLTSLPIERKHEPEECDKSITQHILSEDI